MTTPYDSPEVIPTSIDVTPSPAILTTLTYNQLEWSDAISELIDNCIDSFSKARRDGNPINEPVIELFIPTKADVRRGQGFFLIRDNGPGLDESGLQNALRAGYSSNQKFGALGLFGVGFNISTGKIGQKTTVTTARHADDFSLVAELDLKEMQERDTFDAPMKRIEKPQDLSHGTQVRIESWWPAGHPNAEFAERIASKSHATVVRLLSRRYATILKNGLHGNRVRLLVYETTQSEPQEVEPFEHCVWGSNRSVDSTWGPIPARIELDEITVNLRRCQSDGSVVPDNFDRCPVCNGTRLRTVEERVRGWVGIQRFDDINDYGIDLIRNGRTIRTAEKDAFFSWMEEDGRLIKEYPVDDQTGRIVGQIHLDHVPVDFMKQDFERTSPEWSRAIEVIRGEQLRRNSWRPEYRNESSISKLNHGYKRIRDFGRKSMYMGRWDPVKRKAVRISRDVERDYLERFEGREPGFYDDGEWWKLVENADVPPPPESLECPTCHFVRQPGDEICDGCGAILQSKECIECRESIAASAMSCGSCGASQVLDPDATWNCVYCGSTNPAEDLRCAVCTLQQGMAHPTSQEQLSASSVKSDDLSRSDISIMLASGERCEPIEAEVWISGAEMAPHWDSAAVPTVSFRSAGKLKIFVDEQHPVFADLNKRPVDVVAEECAHYIYGIYSQLQGEISHTIANLSAQILKAGWENELSMSSVALVSRAERLIEEIADRLAGTDEAQEFYGDLRSEEQQKIAMRIYDAGHGAELSELIESGGYLRFLDGDQMRLYLESFPDIWIENVFALHLPSENEVGEQEARTWKSRNLDIISRSLSDGTEIPSYTDPEPILLVRAETALDYLESKLR